MPSRSRHATDARASRETRSAEPVATESEGTAQAKRIADEYWAQWLQTKREILSQKFWERSRSQMIAQYGYPGPGLSYPCLAELSASLTEIIETVNDFTSDSDNPGEWSIETRRFRYALNSFDLTCARALRTIVGLTKRYNTQADQSALEEAERILASPEVYELWCALLDAAKTAKKARDDQQETFGLTLGEDVTAASKAASYGLENCVAWASEQVSWMVHNLASLSQPSENNPYYFESAPYSHDP